MQKVSASAKGLKVVVEAKVEAEGRTKQKDQ